MDYELSNPLNNLPRCPQCGTARPTLTLEHVVFNHRNLAHTAMVLGWAIYQCTSCKDVIGFKGLFQFYSDINSFAAMLNTYHPPGSLLLPPLPDSFDDLPERARNYLKQAMESLAMPDGAVMLAGSAVDSMLKAKGLAEGSVYARINKAVDDHLLTSEMGEWAHSVRLSANSPRHADLEAPHATREEADAALEFAQGLAQFLFVLPARVARGKLAAQLGKL